MILMIKINESYRKLRSLSLNLLKTLFFVTSFSSIIGVLWGFIKILRFPNHIDYINFGLRLYSKFSLSFVLFFLPITMILIIINLIFEKLMAWLKIDSIQKYIDIKHRTISLSLSVCLITVIFIIILHRYYGLLSELGCFWMKIIFVVITISLLFIIHRFLLTPSISYIISKVTKLKLLKMLMIVILSIFVAIPIIEIILTEINRIDGKVDFGDKRNILLITLDACREDCISFNKNYGFDITPNIDRIASEGIVFNNCFSPCVMTKPSLSSAFSGRYPLIAVDIKEDSVMVRKHIELLPEILDECGYNTYGLNANPFLKPNFGLMRGYDYDETSGYPQTYGYYLPSIFRDIIQFVKGSQLGKHLGVGTTHSSYWITERIKEILKQSDEPFFLWAHYLDPHSPYILDNPYINDRDAFNNNVDLLIERLKIKKEYAELFRRYIEELTLVDHLVGEIVTVLEKNEIEKNTIIIISADHGEEFGEHGNTTHGHSLHHETVHIPLIIKFPNSYNFNHKIIEENVSLTDITPTILEIVGETPSSQMDGKSLIHLIEGRTYKDRLVFSEYRHLNLISARIDDYSIIYNTKDGDVKIFNFKDDPLEKNDLSGNEELKNMYLDKLKEIDRYIIKTISQFETYDISDEVTDREKEMMRGLGYIE